MSCVQSNAESNADFLFAKNISLKSEVSQGTAKLCQSSLAQVAKPSSLSARRARRTASPVKF